MLKGLLGSTFGKPGAFSIEQQEQNQLRRYLLAQLTEAEEEAVELRLLTDATCSEELDILTHELVDQYVNDQLPADERGPFERSFLQSPEWRDKIRFALALKRRSSELKVRKSRVRKVIGLYLPIAASVLLVAGLGLGVWRRSSPQPDVEKGLLALQMAFLEQRPVEARISGFNYAPAAQQRGDPEKTDYVQRERAARLLLNAISENPSASTYHALGKYYLAELQFDKAIEQFEKALSLDGNNAQIHSDLGAAFLEKGKAYGTDAKAGVRTEMFAKSLEHLDRALTLDDSLPEALFNRALCYQNMLLPQQALDAWQKYLGKDPNTQWANEARRQMKALEEQQQRRTSQSNEQVFRDFIIAYREGNAAAAWEVISRSREAITGRPISHQIVNAYLGSAAQGRANEAKEMLQVLAFAGELEVRRAGDPFTAEVARFYGLSPPPRLDSLAQAHVLLKAGYTSCLRSRFGDALEHFKKAEEIFSREGDEPEARYVDYWIGYCYYQMTMKEESLSLLNRLNLTCEKKQYKWLSAQAFNLLATVQTAFNEYSKGIEYTRRALEISEQISDAYGTQKNLAQLANQHRSLGSYQDSLEYMQRCIELAGMSWPGARQMWRNYDTTGRVFFSLGLYAAAAAYSKEALRLGLDEIKDPSIVYVSHVHLGLIYGQLKNYEEGVEHARLGLSIGRSFPDSPVGQKIIAYSSLQLGYLYKQMGDLGGSLANFNQAVQIYDRLAFEVFSYDAHKGRLLCYIAQGDDESARNELRTVLGLFERYRSKILEEKNRNNFFDVEQSVYDLAIDFEFSKNGDQRAALEYSELSRARSLLDLLSTETRFSQRGLESDITFTSVAQPLTLAEIQSRMPDQVQILQYSLLENRLLVWVISKTSFSAREEEIRLGQLSEKIHDYLLLVSSASSEKDDDRRRAAADLYDILIKPVEASLISEKQLCIVPDKILNYLPFGTLLSSGSGKYLIEEFPILYAPSSNIFIASSDRARQKAGTQNERLLSVGNPSFDRQAFKHLPDLPSAGREAVEIARLYDLKRCLIGEYADRKRVLIGMENSDVIHLASHYIVEEKSPMLSKLLLAKHPVARESGGPAGGAIEAQDIYNLKSLRARLVVLSACRTSAENYYKGEGPIGFSRTFLANGIPVIVASQWPVDTNSTQSLMVNFHKYRKLSGLSSVEALRRAQVDMLRSAGNDYQRPYYWAPFIAIGGYAGF